MTYKNRKRCGYEEQKKQTKSNIYNNMKCIRQENYKD